MRRQRLVTQWAAGGAAGLAVLFGWAFAQPNEASAGNPAPAGTTTTKKPATKSPATKKPTTKQPVRQGEAAEEPTLEAPEEPPQDAPAEQEPDAQSGGS
jgi:multidrug efflux pump subunit AcrA (membrane-fusion protein)